MNIADFLPAGSLDHRGHLVNLEFSGYKETYKCTRIQFIRLQLDEDFQEDAETRRNLRVLCKRAAVITGLQSETGVGGSAGWV